MSDLRSLLSNARVKSQAQLGTVYLCLLFLLYINMGSLFYDLDRSLGNLVPRAIRETPQDGGRLRV